LREAAGCSEADGIVVVWGSETDCRTAADEIRIRYVDALDGIPNETRQPLPDGSTDFERILPGPDRMYPDTDSPPTMITRERVEQLRDALPNPPWVREKHYAEAGVPVETIHYLIRRGGADLVDTVVAKTDTSLRRACFFFGQQYKALKRRGIDVAQISVEQWVDFFSLAASNPLAWEDRVNLITELASSPQSDVQTIAQELEIGNPPADWQIRAVKKAQDDYTVYPDDSAARRMRFALGRAMTHLRGKVPVEEVRDMLESEVGNMK
jgi:glutamyl-tRNA(Gln) amidotransferase subunit E